MWLRRLELSDLRSYQHVTLDLPEGVMVLVGANGQGKTNLLEAIYRAATGSSHRAAGDAPLVRAGAQLGVIRCELSTDGGRRRTLDLEVGSGRRTRTRVDGQQVHRSSDALGVLRAVMFAPEDVAIVRGDPSERRRFLDELLAQRRPAFAAARSEYDRALRQRNQLLKQARGLSADAREAAAGTLEVWTEQLVRHGAQIIAARVAAIRTLAGPVDRFYRELADRPERIALTYRWSAGDDLAPIPEDDEVAADPVPDPAPIIEALRTAFADRRGDELARGQTLVGPHRDDLELAIGALPARGYASQGEAWSLALALKLATFEVLAQVGDRPIVLLDDVFAELDRSRRSRLAAACGRFDQTLVSAAVEEDVPLEGARVDVVIDDGVSRLSPRWQAGAA